MPLFILRKPNTTIDDAGRVYSGTYRDYPYYQEQFEIEHPINRSFLSFVQEGNSVGEVETVENARELIHLYREHADEEFELVEIVELGSLPTTGGEFLGWDVSSLFSESYIWYGIMRVVSNTEGINSTSPLDMLVDIFIRLIDRHFTSRLNQDALFDLQSDAEFFLECHNAIDDLQEGIFEDGEYAILGIYRCRID